MITSNKSKVTAVLLTGGEGRRVKDANVPKQFIEICGLPLFIHSLQTYDNIEEVDEIYLVINQNYKHTYEEILTRYTFKKLKRLVPGGTYRQVSVSNALDLIFHDGLAIIQNGVNPMTPAHLIKDCIKAANEMGAVTAYVPASHTVFELRGQRVEHVLDRKTLGYTCDPQVYRIDLIKKAILYAKETMEDIPTIEAVKRMGLPVGIVRSDDENMKLTTNSDVSIINALLTNKSIS